MLQARPDLALAMYLQLREPRALELLEAGAGPAGRGAAALLAPRCVMFVARFSMIEFKISLVLLKHLLEAGAGPAGRGAAAQALSYVMLN